jgi:hypothetical protein
MWERMLEPGVSLWMRATDESTDELHAALVKNNDHRPAVKVSLRNLHSSLGSIQSSSWNIQSS